MVIHEFWTFMTDVILALLCFFFAFQLRHLTRSPETSARYWVPIFISIGVAALSGAIYHGFKPYLPQILFDAFRTLVLFCLSTTAFLISMSLLRFAGDPNSTTYKVLTSFLRLKLIAFFIIAVLYTKFIVGVSDYGSTFIIALLVFGMKLKHPASKGMITAIIISLFAAAIQTMKISPHPNFNHNDLYHVVQMVGLYVFYKSAPKLTDRVSVRS